MSFYPILDKIFILLHSFIIIFNLSGWIWKKTRLANFILLLLTGSSWFILGIWYGTGYCPLTDWHWMVLRKMGQTALPGSYVKYLVDRLFTVNADQTIIDYLTVICFFAALIISIALNFVVGRDLKSILTKK
ncbi:MAG: DUF2784 family protein [Bacteroidetes bacterium]|nr:DUF2784 family protein [Bacteroidota bacterium]